MATVDVEQQRQTRESNGSRVPGYPLLAEQMARHPQIAIFRTFASLNIRTLLRIQGQLHELEAELREVEELDHKSSDAVRSAHAGYWRSLAGCTDDSNYSPEQTAQASVLNRIDALLMQYSKLYGYSGINLC